MNAIADTLGGDVAAKLITKLEYSVPLSLQFLSPMEILGSVPHFRIDDSSIFYDARKLQPAELPLGTFDFDSSGSFCELTPIAESSAHSP